MSGLRQIDRVRLALRLRGWVTLEELRHHVRTTWDTRDTETALSARIRELGQVLPIESRRRGGKGNLWEYRLDLTREVLACTALLRNAPIDIAAEMAAARQTRPGVQTGLFPGGLDR